MWLLDNDLLVSARDIHNHLICPHLTTLDRAWANGELEIEPEREAEAELLAQKGFVHERAYLSGLKEEGREVVEIVKGDGSPVALGAAVQMTEEAMKEGAETIYQARFRRGELWGSADFLMRVDDRPSKFGEYSYEVADTKLALRAKPYFVMQLCFFSELLADAQGARPERVYVILGTGGSQAFRLAEFTTYYRRIADSFLEALHESRETYPEPVDHCELCRWRDACDARRVADDHLSLVASITRRQRRLLEGAGIETLAELGSAGRLEVEGIEQPVMQRLQEQAALQLATRDRDEVDYLLLPLEEERGLARLPRPSRGDVFFDMEGDPLFAEGGLEYLFGFVTTAERDPRHTEIWGRDRVEERLALERFIDFVTVRRERYPDLHVYHYNHYEVTALKRLAGAHGTREEALDRLLREEVFVDLYKVVREGVRVSQPSYSIKKIEALYMEPRETEVAEAGDSILMFERWLQNGDPAILARIAAYNRDDCLSTLRLRDWLVERRKEAERHFAGSESWMPLRWFEPKAQVRGDDSIALRQENQALVSELLEGISLDEEPTDPDEWDRLMMARLLEYHDREERPAWWSFFDRMKADAVELSEDADCIARIEPDAQTPARKEQSSLVHALCFPPQETKLHVGSEVADVASGESPGSIVTLEPERGRLELKRDEICALRPFPKALMPGRPYRTIAQKGALRRLAISLLDNGGEAYPAAIRLLRCQPPLLCDREPGEAIDHWDLSFDELKGIVADLDHSYLFIQGPPGSGKTWSGARLIVYLIQCGHRVGVTGNSHKVIHNILHEIEEVAHEQQVSFLARQKCSSKKPESEFNPKYGLVESVEEGGLLNDPEVALSAATAWHYCREDTARLDYLFIDEAGQVALADALALTTAATNVVLLGDPQQLPQVARGTHPRNSSCSVLEHLLGDAQTVSRTHGVFLDETYRLHPDVCDFVSELMYDSRLVSAPGRERQCVDAEGELTGTGLRWMPVLHQGHSQSSPEEAERIAAAVEPLLEAGYVTDANGERRSLRPEDVLVVAPYNTQVNCLQDRLPSGVRVGTVDKLQGQQAEVVFFSMATSSGEEMPRNIEFLFSRNRLNVALSRARCLAILVCSPRLLDIRPTSIEQMRLVNALCRFTEIAQACPAPTPCGSSVSL